MKRALAALVVALALGGAVAAYGYTSLRWDCPSYAEAGRPRTPDEAERAFAAAGIGLVRAPGQPLRPATSYRHEAGDTVLTVIVCRTNTCTPALLETATGKPIQRGVAFLNVRAWVVAPRARAANARLAQVDAAAPSLSPSGRDARCFPN